MTLRPKSHIPLSFLPSIITRPSSLIYHLYIDFVQKRASHFVGECWWSCELVSSFTEAVNKWTHTLHVASSLQSVVSFVLKLYGKKRQNIYIYYIAARYYYVGRCFIFAPTHFLRVTIWTWWRTHKKHPGKLCIHTSSFLQYHNILFIIPTFLCWQ